MKSDSLDGYWTGEFEGTNSGGLSLCINQQGTVLRGVATMNEPTIGIYQYAISGQVGPPIRLLLNPATQVPDYVLGVIDASCRLDNDGKLIGRWQSTLGTTGVFQARRYQDSSDPTAEKPRRRRVFISYSHIDKPYLEKLLVHLKPLEKLGLIDAWSDQRIKAGALWKKEIEEALAESHAAILLVSAEYLASDFIVSNELPVLLTRAKDEGVRILPVILRTCRFSRDTSLSLFQAINDPKTPIASLEEWKRDEVYDRVAHEIENLSTT